ncbi:MAG: hypothetical protein GTN53_36270 [Candidatus Aminicenantes bacterium]|nr:hypothetical protein [Candidatus Aminicenantes bacterium]NIQ71933.1 hypothetical protein [Candidatus Aminicenantes bacterium]NIT27973.1 hypothetical protein [Candidatus Aminicenantes bacterium]
MYYETINIIWKANSFEASVSLCILEKYVNRTIIQWNRIQESKELLPGPGPGVDQTLMEYLFSDIHFYFICYDKAQNLLENLAKADGDPKLDNLWQTFKPKFKPFNDARNHLEHIETRITKKYLMDFGNLEDDTFTFGGERFDISVSGLKILTDAYEQVVDIFKARGPNLGRS